MSAHTPGPWHQLSDGFIYAKDGVRVADPSPWSPIHKARPDIEIKANTRLIEAAPGLLQAMQEVAATEMFLPDHPRRQAAYKACRAAIENALSAPPDPAAASLPAAGGDFFNEVTP